MKVGIKNRILIVLFCVLFISAKSCSPGRDTFKDAFTFIAAADMRFYATEKYRTSQHFLGAVEAIRKVGKGALMISPGDTDPPQVVREVLSMVLGEDYPWYPSMGNHELDSDAYVEWLRQYNKDGTALPHVVRKGPPGCEETTFSFDWNNCHFVALNQYFDGHSDMGTDGDIVPELLVWLEHDLAENTKPFVFVYGHEPIIALPDMDNGKIKHQGDSLDKYPKNAFNFHQLLLKYRITAYICGHSHSTSFGNINGIWQIDVGHARGIEENSAPEIIFQEMSQAIQKSFGEGMTEKEAIRIFYTFNTAQCNKTLFYTQLAQGQSYNDIPFEPGFQGLLKFNSVYKKGGDTKEILEKTFWENAMYRKSSFFKFYVGGKAVKVEIYRDDGHGGAYSLRHSLLLN